MADDARAARLRATFARPARKQISATELDAIRTAAERVMYTGEIYNIWFNKMSCGGIGEVPEGKTKSRTRCNIARDSGYTRADMRSARLGAGQRVDPAFCCLFFARGCCPRGSECSFLHRLPRVHEIEEQGVDVFGREKHGSFRDDMGGVGSMLRVNRTLYVGRIHEDDTMRYSGKRPAETAEENRDNPLDRTLRRHFGEWGEIERVRVLPGRGIAFVTYKYEANAQFAKEAMMHQSLDNDEVLNVRWSTDDPRNPGQDTEADARERGEKHITAVAAARKETEDDFAAHKDEKIDWEEYARAKRQRLALSEAEMRRLDEENRRGWEDVPRAKTEAQAKPAEPAGILSADALRSLKTLRRPAAPSASAPAAPPAQAPLAGVAAYASDSE
ncbi:Pre-mRNA-splicing factor [Malassezia cuniculi]|uniref:Pre-mRNA-splicing factor n=1 Tax=Malassezia cuniculi TaxID=948313 RepID=A0AAF0ERM3_9BASI|nr:Pre-mRNA-splicing factor [Malassezia cuniculi]